MNSHKLLPLAAIFLLSGCPQSNKIATPTHKAEAADTTTAQGWSALRYQQTCPTVSAQACVGAYGFTIQSSGHYIIGPAPDGAALQGELRTADFQSIVSLANAEAASVTGAVATCTAAPTTPSADDYVDMTVPSPSTVTRILDESASQGRVCFVGNLNQAQALRQQIQTILPTYAFPARTEATNPIPTIAATPSTSAALCTQATLKLQSDYDAVRVCSDSTECNYVSGFYTIVPRNQTGVFIPSSANCAVGPAYLTVANGNLVQAQSQLLLFDKNTQQNACLGVFPAQPCGGGFTPLNPPACLAGVCQIQP